MAVADERVFKRPESVLVVVYTRAGEVLMLRRRRPPWFWQSVTGSLGWEETPAEAARRELREETGLDAGARLVDCGRSVMFPIIPPWKSRYSPAVRFNREHWFALPLESRRTLRLQPHEHREYRWMSFDESLRRLSSWSNRDAVAAVFGGSCRGRR